MVSGTVYLVISLKCGFINDYCKNKVRLLLYFGVKHMRYLDFEFILFLISFQIKKRGFSLVIFSHI